MHVDIGKGSVPASYVDIGEGSVPASYVDGQ